MENDPRRRRPRGRRTPKDAQKPTRPPAQPRPPSIRGGTTRGPGQARGGQGAAARDGARRDGANREQRGARGGRGQRTRSRPPSGPGELRAGTPCLIVLDCRDGEPDRSGAAAVFEGFFDLETGEPRVPGLGIPRLRVIAPPAPAIAAASQLADQPTADPAAASATPLAADPVPAPPRSPASPAPNERLWGFECWWRPDPTRGGLTVVDHEELEQSKRLLRGLLRDTRRAGRSLQPR